MGDVATCRLFSQAKNSRNDLFGVQSGWPVLTLGKRPKSLVDFKPNPFLCFYQDPKRHLEESVEVMMTSDIVQCLGAMLNSVVF